MKKLFTVFLFCLGLTLNLSAQTNAMVKGIVSFNVDSATFKSIVASTLSTYGNLGALYYNKQSSKWRIFSDSIWYDLNIEGNSIFARNGLTLDGDTVILGDNPINRETLLDIVSEIPFTIKSSDGVDFQTEQIFYSETDFSSYNLDITGGNDASGFLARLNGNDAPTTGMYETINAGVSKIEFNSVGMNVTDGIFSKGLVYAADYSTNFSARSIVDKAYVDAQTVSASNGLTKTANNIALGGALTGTTTISGAQTLSLTNSTTTFSGTTLNTQPTTWNIGTAPTITSGIKFAFNPSVTTAGMNVGSLSGNPSALSDGDMWYDNSGLNLMARVNGSTRTLVTTAQTQTLTNKTLSTGTVFSASPTINSGVKFTFSPNASNTGMNVGSVSGNPSSLSDGDLYINSLTNVLLARINGSTTTLVNTAGMTQNRVQYGGANFATGGITDEADFTYNPTTNTLTTGLTSGSAIVVNGGNAELSMYSSGVLGMYIHNTTESGNGIIEANGSIETIADGGFKFNSGVSSTSNRIYIQEGSDANMGVATLVGGTVTVNNLKITANTRIFYSVQTAGGTQGFLSTTRVANTSFTINSTSGTDTSTIAWVLIEPY